VAPTNVVPANDPAIKRRVITMLIQSIAVKDYMNTSLVMFAPEMDVMQAIVVLVKNRISAAPVLNERGDLVGVLSEKDCMNVAVNAGYHEEYGGQVKDFMSVSVVSVEANDTVIDVANMFLNTERRRFPVLEDNRLVGVISRRDVLRALVDINKR